MAILDIGQPTWRYDTQAKALRLTFVEPCPRGEPDPAKWRPSWDYTLTLPLPGVVSKIPHVDPNEPPPAVPPQPEES